MKSILFVISLLILILFSLQCEREDLYYISIMKGGTLVPPEKIYFFSDGVTTDGNLLGRDGANAKCQTVYNTYFTGDFQAPRVKALISTGPGDQVKDLIPAEWGYVPVYGMHFSTKGEILIKNSWSQIWSEQTLNNTLNTALGLGISFWAGSNPDGSATGNTCSGWTNTAVNGNTGNSGVTSSSWIFQNTYFCTDPYAIVCIGY